MTVKVTKDNLPALLKAVKQLTSKETLIGIPAENAGRNDGSPVNNAEIGYIQEFGSPEQNIPARPFLVPGVQGALPQITARMKVGGTKALSGDMDAADKTLNAVGLIGQNAVRAKINEGIPPALSPRTLADRRARGRTGEKPLVDTGALRNSVTYVVRGPGKGK